MTPEPDGSYWGLHQWYYESAACVRNPILGPAAWRVMEAGGGAHFLLACLSSPGGPQPTIAPGGATANVGYGCFKSAAIAPIPVQASPMSPAGVQSFTRSLSLPSTGKCLSARVIEIHVKDPKHDPLREVIVTIGRRHVRVLRHGNRFVKTIKLTGLPSGTFTVRIRATTVLGHHISGSRTYHTCVKKRGSRRQAQPVRQTSTR